WSARVRVMRRISPATTQELPCVASSLCPLRRSLKQVNFLTVRLGQHVNQSLIRWISSKCLSRLENRCIDHADAFSQLRDCLGRELGLSALDERGELVSSVDVLLFPLSKISGRCNNRSRWRRCH